jgi:hypothetical protein
VRLLAGSSDELGCHSADVVPVWCFKLTPTTDDHIHPADEAALATTRPGSSAPRDGRPRIGSAEAEVMSVRLGPELRAAIEARSIADQTAASHIIRRALRRFLEVA